MFDVLIIAMSLYKEVMSNYTIILPSSIGTYDVVKKRARVLGIIFTFSRSFQNVSYVFVKIIEPLYIGTLGLCIFG